MVFSASDVVIEIIFPPTGRTPRVKYQLRQKAGVWGKQNNSRRSGDLEYPSCGRFRCFSLQILNLVYALRRRNLRFDLQYHRRQLFFTFFEAVGVDVPGVLFSVGPLGIVTSLP